MIINDPLIFTIIAYIAGICTMVSFLPQVIKTYRVRKVTGISGNMYVIYNLGLVCWFSYGVYIESWPLIAFNIITFLFTFPILLMILYYDDNKENATEPKKSVKKTAKKKK